MQTHEHIFDNVTSLAGRVEQGAEENLFGRRVGLGAAIGTKYITVGRVIRISPLRNKVSHAVSAETASAKIETTTASNEMVELNRPVIQIPILSTSPTLTSSLRRS